MSPAGLPARLIPPILSRGRPALPNQSPLNRFVRAAVALFSLWAAACGDGTTEPAPTPNQAPLASGAIQPQTVAVGQTVTVDVSSYFTDPDGDALTFTAASSNAATASVAVSGGVVTVTAAARGVVTVTVTARDPGGLSAQLAFTVTVPNQGPVAVGAVPAQTVFVGETASVDMAAHFNDPDGDALNFAAASANAGVVSVMIAGSTVTITAVAPGATMVTVTAADPERMSAQQTLSVTVPNRRPVAVDTIPGQSVEPGQSVAVDLSPFFNDPDNETLSYAAASSNAGVATATVAGSSVTVSGVAAGTVVVTVTASDPGQLSAQQRFTVTVRAANQAPEVVSTISDLNLTVGETRDWRGGDHFRDPNGDPLTYAVGSSNAAVVLAAASGGEFGIVALSAGTATVTVTASDPGGLSGRLSFQVTVTTPTPVAISTVQPNVLVEGANATITGSGFAVPAAQNHVSVGGLAARVTSASPTSLSIVVPRSDCLPPRRDELRVSVGSRSDARTVGVTPGSAENYSAFQAGLYVNSHAGSGCVHLPGSGTGGEYLIGVVSTSEDPSSLTAVTLNGTPGDATIVGAASQAIASVSTASELMARVPFEFLEAGSGTVRTTVSADWRFDNLSVGHDSLRIQRATAHNDMMARNKALMLGFGRRSLAEIVTDRYQRVEVGDTLSLYAEYGDARFACSEARQVNAVVRLVGNHTIWLEDLSNPSGTFSDAELSDLDWFYGANIRGVHDSYYGSLSDTDSNERILVLMTQEVNRAGDLGGYVWAGDLFPNGECATSNQAEIFYGLVPDPDAIVGNAWTKERLLAWYPSLIAHEVTHIIQFAGQVFGGAGRKATWEVEGGATLAEQLVAYRLFGHGSGQEMGYTEYYAGRDWYWDWLGSMFRFFGWDSEGGSGRVLHAPEQCSWVGRPEEGNDGPCREPGRAVYGVPSMVFRYAMDRWGEEYSGGEEALMQRLTQSPNRGFSSLEDVSAWRIEHILSDFYITLWLDLQGLETYGMASWNLRDISSRYNSNRQLQPYTSSSTQPRQTASVRAGSSLYLHWTPTGSLSPTAIKVTSASGGPVSEHISVWALRIR